MAKKTPKTVATPKASKATKAAAKRKTAAPPTSVATPKAAKATKTPRKSDGAEAASSPVVARSPVAERTQAKLSKLATQVIGQVSQKKNPTLMIPSRSLSNAYFDEKKGVIQLGDDKTVRQFFNASMAKKFMQTFLVADECRKLIDSGKTASIRDLYYRAKHTLGDSKVNTFDDQDESDPIIEDLEVTSDALREELHLAAETKGSMVGPLTIRDKGDEINLRVMGSGGYSVPSIVEPDVIEFLNHDAKYVLLIEKGAVWSRFNEDKFWQKNKCIILHGGGQPPRGVRRLLQRLRKELKLPVYVLVDNDPWGFYIYSVVKQGSINLAYESMRMAVPDARFIGLSSFDAMKYGIPEGVAIKMTDKDVGRAKEMLAYPWFKDVRWQREINEMIRSGKKYEIQALSNRDISFVTEQYLPKKLRDRDWLE
jgi:DNA topoisomerase-6 subunit A